jgi:hypothetical protein
VLQRTAATVFVEIPSSAITFKPVSDREISGPPTTGAAPAVGGIMAAGGKSVAGVCCANATEETSASHAATKRGIIRIEASSTSLKQ